METVLDGVNHIAILTSDMDRFIRFYQEAFDATVVHDNRNHGGHAGERMVILALGGQSAFNVFEVPGNTQAHVQTGLDHGVGHPITLRPSPWLAAED